MKLIQEMDISVRITREKGITIVAMFLNNISKIHSFLPDKAAVQLTHAFVSSRLGYYNSLLKGCLLVPSDVYSPYNILQHATSRGRVTMNT